MRSVVRNAFGRAVLRPAAVAGLGLLCLEASGVRAQTTEPVPRDAVKPAAEHQSRSINLGNRGWQGTKDTAPKEREANRLEFSAKAGAASDYIYRGTTLSDRKPAVGAGGEATYSWLYAGVTVASVKLPSQPTAEITFAGGIRPSIGNVDFDFGAIYFHYPGEAPGGPGIDYWEASARGDTTIGEAIRIAGGFAYSPDVSNTGAWGWYAAFGAGYEVPTRIMDFTILITAAAGYSWFGNQSLALGGFELPAYLNWQAGVTFTHKIVNLDLRYHDTNLSKEDCYVFTGDPNAQPGGRVNPISNPGGLTSRWCGATIVAKAWFALN